MVQKNISRIKKVLFSILLLIAADFLTGKSLHYLFNRQQSGWEHETSFAINEVKADVLLLGSSRAQHSYAVDLMEKIIGISCYNAGRDGQSIFYHYPVFAAYLKRANPKLIIMDCETEMLAQNSYSFDRIACLLPYYQSHPEMRQVLEKRSRWEKLKLLSQTYPYNSMILKIVSGNLKKKDEDAGYQGYLPLDRSLNETIRTVDLSAVKYELDPYKLELLRDLMQTCNERNIPLYLICSPYYSTLKGEDASLQMCKAFCKQYHANYLDFAQDSFLLRRPDLFDDTAHVNHRGALHFTEKVCDQIKPSIR